MLLRYPPIDTTVLRLHQQNDLTFLLHSFRLPFRGWLPVGVGLDSIGDMADLLENGFGCAHQV